MFCCPHVIFFLQCGLHFVFFLDFCLQPNKSLLFFLTPAWMLSGTSHDRIIPILILFFNLEFAIHCFLFFRFMLAYSNRYFKPVCHVIKEKYSTCALTKANDSDKLFHPTVDLRHAHFLCSAV